jgi:uncharacterized protein (DUF169 family)
VDLDLLQKYGEEITKRVCLRSFPLAVKLFKEEKDIPKEAIRPIRDWGYPVPLCQAYATARREGSLIVMSKEDIMWCFEPVVGYGFAEPPQYFLDGHNRVPEDVKNLEAGKNYASDFPRLQVGRYAFIAVCPLKTTCFEPDLVMIYCDSEQLSLLLLAREYKEGHDLKVSLSSHAACVYSVVPLMQTGECRVAIPCRGDRYEAMAQHDELIFTIPKDKLEDLIEGLRFVETTGSKLPKNYKMMHHPDLKESYRKILEMIK